MVMSKFIKVFIAFLLMVTLLFNVCLSAVAAAPAVEAEIEDTIPTFDTNRIIVKYKDEQTVSVYSENQLSAASQKIVKLLKNRISKNTALVSVDNISDVQAALQTLQNDPTVEYALPDTKVFAMGEDKSVLQWGILNTAQEINGISGAIGTDINATSAWEISDGSDVVVAVLDSGVDINHPDLKNNIFANKADRADGADNDKNGYIDDTLGWDFVNDDSSVFDANEDVHGTAVAGIIAALNNQTGVTGVAYNSKILPLKVLENGEGYVSDVIEAISYAKAMGATVVNCSWGSSEYNYALKDAMRNSGLMFVCAAGNYGAESVCYPAGFSLTNVISVGAVDNTRAIMQDSGSADVYAPGKDIYTTALNNSYAYFSGTSAAAAYITGTAALIKSVVPNIMSGQIKAAIKTGTDHTKLVSAQKAITAALPINYLPENSGRLNRALEHADILINAPVAEILATCSNYGELSSDQKNTLMQFFGFSLTDMQTCADNSLDLVDSIIAILSANRADITIAQTLSLMLSLTDEEQFDSAVSYISDVKEIIELTSVENYDVIELVRLGYNAEQIALAIVFARTTNADLLSSVTKEPQTIENVSSQISGNERLVAFTIMRRYNIKASVLNAYLQNNQITATELYENLLTAQENLGFTSGDGKITAFSNFTTNTPYYNKYKVSNGYVWQHGDASVDQTDGMLSYSIPLLSLAGRNGLDLNFVYAMTPKSHT